MSGRGRQFYLLNQGKPIVTGGGCVTNLTPCGKRQTGDENLLTLQKIEGWVTAGWCQLLLIMNSVFKAGVRKRLERHKPCAGLERLVQQHLIHRRCGLMVFGLLNESFYLVARYCSVCSS